MFEQRESRDVPYLPARRLAVEHRAWLHSHGSRLESSPYAEQEPLSGFDSITMDPSTTLDELEGENTTPSLPELVLGLDHHAMQP